MSTLKKISSLAFAFILLGLLFTACTDEDAIDIVQVSSFSSDSVESLQSRVVGKNFCLEFVFPITIEFVDATTAEVADYDELYTAITAWFEANEVEDIKENIPQLVFPVEVLDTEGEINTVESLEDLKQLKRACRKSGNKKCKRGKNNKCFSLVYPLTVTIGGEDMTFDDRAELKTAIKAYKEEAGEDAESPSVVFPITVEYEDGTLVEVESQEMLEALKEACKDEEGGEDEEEDDDDTEGNG